MTLPKQSRLSTAVDILINSAGILKTGSIVDLPVEEWEQVLQINVLGTYYFLHEVMPTY